MGGQGSGRRHGGDASPSSPIAVLEDALDKLSHADRFLDSGRDFVFPWGTAGRPGKGRDQRRISVTVTVSRPAMDYFDDLAEKAGGISFGRLLDILAAKMMEKEEESRDEDREPEPRRKEARAPARKR